jgi:hypothetical protein
LNLFEKDKDGNKIEDSWIENRYKKSQINSSVNTLKLNHSVWDVQDALLQLNFMQDSHIQSFPNAFNDQSSNDPSKFIQELQL